LKGFGDVMSISERITGTIEDWRVRWNEALKAFLVSVLSFGFEVFFDVLGKSFAPKLSPFIKTLEDTGKVPVELQPLLDEMKGPTGEVAAMLSQSAGGSLIGGAFGKIVDTVLLPIAYVLNAKTQNVILTEGQYIILWLRKFITDTEFKDFMEALGHSSVEIDQIKELATVRLNPETIARLWLRDKETWGHLWQDLSDSGVSEERIEAFKEVSYLMPTYQDVVNFMAHEVFEEDAVAKYGLDNEFENLDLSWFERVGVKPELAKQLWRNHWQHPAFREITELLHRGEVTEEDVYDWYRLVEIPPYWRDKLTSISWDLPNRIELRMMARYGLVDKAFLLEQLKQVGLKEEFRDVAADMMLAMGIRTDLSTRFSKGWIDAATVESELVASGLSLDVRTRMFQWIVKNLGTDRVEKERDLTKSEIYKAIKKGKMEPPQGVELIQRMGYDSEEATLLVEINVGALEGSPETYQEFKKWVELYRQSQRLDAKIPSEELIQAEKDVLEAELVLRQVKAKERADITVWDAKGAVDEAKIRFHQLLKAT